MSKLKAEKFQWVSFVPDEGQYIKFEDGEAGFVQKPIREEYKGKLIAGGTVKLDSGNGYRSIGRIVCYKEN